MGPLEMTSAFAGRVTRSGARLPPFVKLFTSAVDGALRP